MVALAAYVKVAPKLISLDFPAMAIPLSLSSFTIRQENTNRYATLYAMALSGLLIVVAYFLAVAVDYQRLCDAFSTCSRPLR